MGDEVCAGGRPLGLAVEHRGGAEQPPQITDERGRGQAVAAGAATSGRTWSLKRSRRIFLSNLPTDVLGTSSMKTTSSGSHHLATLPSRKFRMSSRDRVTPARGTTQASGRSSHFGCATAITAASATSGWDMISPSSSTLEIHSPPDLTKSLVRSTMRM